MKKIVVFLGTVIGFAVVGALLDSWLGISFPSFSAAIAYKVFYMAYGGVVGSIVAKS